MLCIYVPEVYQSDQEKMKAAAAVSIIQQLLYRYQYDSVDIKIFYRRIFFCLNE